MANTLNNKKGQDDKKYKVINLKYEYEGYEGNEKWAIISELSEKELFGLYPDKMRRYSPFILLSIEQGKVIDDFKLNEDKYRKRSINNEDYFGYSEGLTENLHTEAIVPDFVEQQEDEEYCQMREELKQQLFDKAMESLTEKQRKYLLLGRDKLREMTNREDCPFILWNGSKRLIKRRAFDEYILKAYSI